MANDQNFVHGDIELVTGALESSAYGTDATPANTAAFDLSEFELNLMIEHIKRKRISDVFDARGSIPGRHHWEYSMEMPFGGPPDPSSSDLAEPDWGFIFECAGFVHAATGTPIDTHTYTLFQGGAAESATLYAYRRASKASNGWDLYKLTGCQNAISSITAATDAEVMVSLAGMGKYNAVTQANPAGSGSGYQNDSARAIGLTMTLGGTSYTVRQFELTSPYEVKMRPDVTDATGVRGFHITKAPDGCWVLNVTYELQQIGDYNHITAALAITDEALSITIPTMGGAQHVITASAAQRGPFSMPKDEGAFVVEQEIYIKNTDLQIVTTRP